METAILDVLAEVDEYVGRPVQLGDGSLGVYCLSCRMLFTDFAQYRHHADNNPGHRRPSPVLVKKNRQAIAAWEKHRLSKRRELGLEP